MAEPPPDPFSTRWRRATGLDRVTAGGRTLDWENRPAPFKTYPGARRIDLPQPSAAALPAPTLWELFAHRRSRRDFSGGEIPLAHLAALAWASQGITARHGPYLLRTTPSAGALYPYETYVSVQAVAEVAPCLAHLHGADFALEVLEEGNLGPYLARAALGQDFLARASAVFLWTAVPPRGEWKYGDRAFRYLGLDLGHVGQNLALAAEALGLGCCPVAAFFDDEMNRLLDLEGDDEFAYYLAAVGPVAPAIRD